MQTHTHTHTHKCAFCLSRDLILFCSVNLLVFMSLYDCLAVHFSLLINVSSRFHLVFCLFQARNKTGKVGYVPEKYLQFPTSNSLLSMLQSLATLDARSHTSSNSTEPELHSNCINGDTNSECTVNQPSAELSFLIIKLHGRSKRSLYQLHQCKLHFLFP